MTSIKFDGATPTLSAMKDMSSFMKGLTKWGNRWSKNRYFVYEGSIMRAGQSTKKGAMKYMKKGRTLFTVIPDTKI